MSAHDKQMVLHQTLQQLQQLGGSADPDNMLAVSDQELVDHTNVVTDQDLFIVVENDEQSAEVIVNPNGNRGMIRMVSLSSFWSGSGSYFYSYFYSYSYTTVNILFLRDPKYEYKYIYSMTIGRGRSV